MQPQISEKRFTRDAPTLTATLDLVTLSEDLAARYCGPSTALDRAVLLVGCKHGGAGK